MHAEEISGSAPVAMLSYTFWHDRLGGIRVALGAQRSDISRLVVGRGTLLAAVGIGIGVAGAPFTTRLLRQLLFHVEPFNPLTFIGVTLLVGVIALLACGLPARRATSVDPAVALRYE